MRVSADPASPFYKGEAHYDVLLDGVAQKKVVEADDEEGWVIRTVLDADGCIVVEGEGEDAQIKLETVSGTVQLVRI